MKNLLLFTLVALMFHSVHSQIAQQNFEGPITSPWQGDGTVVGSQGGNWNTHNGGGMYQLEYYESIYVTANLPAVTKYIGLWINEEVFQNNSISIDLLDNSGTFIQNIGLHPASSSGYWYFYQYQIGAGYTGNYRVAFSRIYSNNTGPNATFLDDITITTTVPGAGVEELTTSDFKLYPNPGNDQLNLVLKNNFKDGVIEILDLSGKTVYTENESIDLFANETKEIDITNLVSGIYIFKLMNSEHSITQKIVVE